MKYDLIIIGAGPGGLTAAIYAKRANMNVLIIEKGAPGGQMINTYSVENYPGFENISGADLAINMFNQVMSMNIECVFESVVNIKEGFVVTTNDNTYESKNIIIATGQRPKGLNLDNEEKLIGRGISYCAICDGSFYKKKDVIIVGGGNSAIEEALYLSKICNSVFVLVRNQMRASKSSIDALEKQNNVTIYLKEEVKEYLVSDNKFIGVNTNKRQILASGLFLYVGNIPQTEFLSNFDILDENGYIKTNEFMETSIKGLYAVGDCRAKDLRQIITACNDGAIAANKVGKDLE